MQRAVEASKAETAEKQHLDNLRIAKLESLMQEFCDRVDRGEVRSKTTYAKFKEALGK